MARVLASLVAIATLSAGSLVAQEPELPAGTRVRVRASGATTPLTGTVAWRDVTRLAVRRSSGDTAIVPLSALTSVDVSQGRRSNVFRGARTGALIGTGAGILLGIGAMADNGGFIDYGAEAIPLGAIGGAFIGGTAGLLIGAMSSSEQWAPADVRITILPGSAGTAVRANMRF
jgi:hypothetical protein